MNTIILTYRNSTKRIVSWQTNQNTTTKFLLAIVFSCLTGIFAQLRIQLPFTPVPITLQTVAVLGSGIFLGPIFGCLAQFFYVLLGASCIDWFAGRTGGLQSLLGPTGGYLIGFIIASFAAGFLREKLITDKFSIKNFFVLLIAINFLLIYIPGILQLFFWYKIAEGEILTMNALLIKGVIPYVLGDLLKITALTIYAKF